MIDEIEDLHQIIKSLPDNAVMATAEDERYPVTGVDLLVLDTVERSRAGIENAIFAWEHRMRRPGGLIVIPGYDDDRYPEYTEAVDGWLRRRAEFWQAVRVTGKQLVVRARPRR